MALCKKCLIFNELHDEIRQNHNDVDDNTIETEEKHFCAMYDNGIPNEIYYASKECEFFTEK